MTHLILITHGQTDWSKENRIQGNLEIPLNEQGRKESIQIAKSLNIPIDVIYTSQLSRAYQTADIITKRLGIKKKSKRLKELNEINQGLWQGLPVEQIRKRYKKIFTKWKNYPTSVKPPQGESLAQVYDRVITTVQKIADKYPSQNICLVTHKIVTALIKIHYLNLDMDKIWEILPEPASWEILTVK